MPLPMLALLLAVFPGQAPALQPAAAAATNPARDEALGPGPNWKALGRSLWFDPEGRRVVIQARVVLREGALEHLLCVKGAKDHESVLGTQAPPRLIHAGLLLTGAEPGHPVRFLPKFEAPAGPRIRIALEWTQDGRRRQADARDWVWDERDKKPLRTDWVFAGSELVKVPNSPTPYYTAEDGDLFTVANFGNAILDLPFASTDDNAGRAFSARTDQIPPIGTEVWMSLRPVDAPGGGAAPQAP